MHRLNTLVVLGVLIWIAMWLQGLSLPAQAKTEISAGAEIQADDKTTRGMLDETVGEILATFKRAEKAIKARDLDALMAFYSEDYNYRGLTKGEVRKIWEDLFSQYRRISSTHILSRIVVRGGKGQAAEVTCTGTLWATSNAPMKRVNIDSWFEEVHYLVYENGAWRIHGGVGEVPKRLQFGIAPHPLF